MEVQVHSKMCILRVRRPVFVPVEMLMPLLMSLLFWEIAHGIKILSL